MLIQGLAEGLASCAEFWCCTRYSLPGKVRLQAVSPMLCDLVGRTQEELCAMDIEDLVHPEDMVRSVAARHDLIQSDSVSGVYRTITRWRHRMGRYVALEWASNRTDSNYTFHVARDVTKLRLDFAEQKLALANMRELATTDTLTGLLNRRMMLETLDKELARARRTGKPLSLATFDVDHFKRVNDTFGHDVGDEVLREVADCLRKSVRLEDTCYRPGGEEFTVLLPECSAGNAIDVVERVLTATKESTRVTLSAGVSCYPTLAVSAESLLKTSDVALYGAKKSGRNRAGLAETSPV